MNWDDLKIVDAAARTWSLSGAAKMLAMSQPQLSRRLRQFEDQIGARLFERTPTGLKPTEAGAKLIPLAADMRRDAEAALRTLPDLPGSALRVVRVSVDEVRAETLALGFPALKAAVGDIELELVVSQQHADHQNRGTELQIRSCLPETDTLVAHKIGELTYAPYAARCYLDRGSIEGLSEAIKRGTWIGFPPDNLWYPSHRIWLEKTLRYQPALRTNTMTSARDLVASGAGIALLPVFMGDANPGLVRLGDTVQELTGNEHLIVHRDLLREPAVRAVSDAIAAAYRSIRQTLSGGSHLKAAG
ncbi:LysR family transcriptional regulator [Roseibium hamelinense]|nr:LysR family transcriptional regulator [Roseibium hamelinense]MTI45665.1 LysR family transcriptional regulator [Roseibium hamelinense]